jgi:hypothetical protein
MSSNPGRDLFEFISKLHVFALFCYFLRTIFTIPINPPGAPRQPEEKNEDDKILLKRKSLETLNHLLRKGIECGMGRA